MMLFCRDVSRVDLLAYSAISLPPFATFQHAKHIQTPNVGCTHSTYCLQAKFRGVRREMRPCLLPPRTITCRTGETAPLQPGKSAPGAPSRCALPDNLAATASYHQGTCHRGRHHSQAGLAMSWACSWRSCRLGTWPRLEMRSIANGVQLN